MTSARLIVTPSPAVVDQPVSIRLVGCAPRQTVTIRVRMRGAFGGKMWESHADFDADPSGVIDVSLQAPWNGTYQGVDPRGLFWSMALTTPDETGLPWSAALPLDTELIAEADGAVLAEAGLTRLFLAPDVTKRSVRDDGLVATFFEPARGPHAAVIMLGGSGGGLSEGNAALLASHGLAVLALAYFRAEHLPEDLVGIPLEYVETAIRWLQRQPSVRGPRLGVMGSSRGGELALLLGATFPEFGAVVGNVPSGVVHMGLARQQTADSPPRAAWLHHGEPIAFLQSTNESARARAQAPSDVPLPLTPIFLKMLEDHAAVERATIPVERIRGPVLLISGQDDQMWPSPTLAEIAMRRLAAHHHPHSFEHLSYPGAGHLIGPPGLPATVTAVHHRLAGRWMAFGGNPQDNAAAAADSWPRVIAFFHRALDRS